MNNITNLPKEIFQKIAKDFAPYDLERAQNVCKAWYRPFHLRFLNTIILGGTDSTKRFINSINANPDPAYLNEVKIIHFFGEEENDLPANEELFQHVFFRFRNLAEVNCGDQYWLVSKFNEALCQKFLECCPKLDCFKVELPDSDDPSDISVDELCTYYRALYHVQPLLTDMDVIHLPIYAVEDLDQRIAYASSFPRLKKMDNDAACFKNFRAWLPILQYLQHFQTLTITKDDKEERLERYMKAGSPERQQKKVTRLSKVRVLRLEGDLANSVSFASKYLTGLESFTSNGNFFMDQWTDLQVERYCNNLWKLASATKISSQVTLKCLKHTFLSTYFPMMARKIYYNEELATRTNCLRLFVEHAHPFETGFTQLSMHSVENRRFRLVQISFKSGTSMNDIASTLFTSQLDMITSFELDFTSGGNKGPTFISAIDKILAKMPSIKSLTLDIPTLFEDDGPTTSYCGLHVEQVVVGSGTGVNYGWLFNRFYYTFPKIKKLSIYDYSGVWRPETGEFDLNLSKYSLVQLVVDLSPMKDKLLEHLIHISPAKQFFVINVENNGKKYLYRAPLDFSFVSEVSGEDLVGFTCGTDFYKLNITINSLLCLKLYIYYNNYNQETKDINSCQIGMFRSCTKNLAINYNQ